EKKTNSSVCRRASKIWVLMFGHCYGGGRRAESCRRTFSVLSRILELNLGSHACAAVSPQPPLILCLK
ncbi:mCG1046120, partial [Mus musculus]